MRNSLLHLPWTLATVPHAALDILRGCNIQCRDCYNLQPDRVRPLSEIDEQLDTLMRLRQLQSICIVGGEITQHPDLVEVVRRVRARGIFVELFTNGVDLDDHLLDQLKRAGASVIFLHIESGQRRPDLRGNASPDDVRELRRAKAALVSAHGMEVGLAITAYPGKLEEVEQAVAFTLESPWACYLLVTWWRNVHGMPAIEGNLLEGMRSTTNSSPSLPPDHEVRPAELCEWFNDHFQLTPFASVGSSQDHADPRWLSFLVATVHQQGKLCDRQSLRPTVVERMFLEAIRKLTGRYPFFQAQRRGQFGLQLLLNGLAGGSLARNLRLLRNGLSPGARLLAKRILFQWPAMLDPEGRVVHCHCCPDAVLKDGRLVPLCLSDRITRSGAASNELSLMKP